MENMQQWIDLSLVVTLVSLFKLLKDLSEDIFNRIASLLQRLAGIDARLGLIEYKLEQNTSEIRKLEERISIYANERKEA